MDGCSFLNVNKLVNAFCFKKTFLCVKHFIIFSEATKMYTMCLISFMHI